jgi:multidrug resistance efflux pump
VMKEKEAVENLEHTAKEKEALVEECHRLKQLVEIRVKEKEYLVEENRSVKQQLEKATEKARKWKRRVELSKDGTGNSLEVNKLRENVYQLEQEVTKVKIFSADQSRTFYDEKRELESRLEEKTQELEAALTNLNVLTKGAYTSQGGNFRRVSDSESANINTGSPFRSKGDFQNANDDDEDSDSYDI